MFVGTRAVLSTAFRGMLTNRLRAFLSTLGISIGVSVLMLIFSVLDGLNKKITDEIAQLGANTLYVSNFPFVIRGDWWRYRNRPPMTLKDVAALRKGAPLLNTVSPLGFAQADVSHRGEAMTDVIIRGTTDEFIEASTLKIESGRFLSPIDVELNEPVVVIGSEVRERLFRQADPLGAKVIVGDQQFRVIGLLKEQGKGAFGRSQDSLAIIPVGRFQEQFGKRRSLLIVVTAPPARLNEAEDQIIETLRRSRGLAADQDDTFSINRQDEIMRIFREQTNALVAVAIIIGAISLMVGGIGVMNIMLVAVTERTREVGVRRALGARRRTILAQFLVEAMLVTLVGGAIGTVVGLGGAHILSLVSFAAATTNPMVAMLGIGVSCVVGIAAGVWPAYRAATLDPIESLRYE